MAEKTWTGCIEYSIPASSGKEAKRVARSYRMKYEKEKKRKAEDPRR